MYELDHAPSVEWVTLTRRTEDPKLSWIEQYLTVLCIPHRRHGSSLHAPILQVEAAHYNEAWAIVEIWDDYADDNPIFTDPAYHPSKMMGEPEEDQLAYWRKAGLDHRGEP